MMQENRSQRFFRIAVLLIVVFVIFVQVSDYLSINGGIMLMSGIWIILILSIQFLLPQVFICGQTQRARESIRGYAFVGAMFCLSIPYIIGAVLNCLSASPYDTSIVGIIHNILRVLPLIIVREMIRAYGVSAACLQKHKYIWMTLLTIVLFGNEINIAKLLYFTEPKTVFVYMAEVVLPLLALNVLLTALAYLGGASASIIYAGLLGIIPFFLPFLPSLPWIAGSAVGICFPLGLLFLLSEWNQDKRRIAVYQKKEHPLIFFATILVPVAFLWFCIGVFPLYPSVVLTGSMQPLIDPGDVVLIRKVTQEKEIYQLAAGDIINFNRENITITHRIVEVVQDDAGNVSFKTKGDNNRGGDSQPVLPEEINGWIAKTIPKVGLPVLLLKSSADIPEGVVDYVEGKKGDQ